MLRLAGSGALPQPSHPFPAMSVAPMQTLTVDLGDRSYPILIGPGLLRQPEAWRSCIPGRQVLVVSNETVAPLYLEATLRALAGLQVETVVLPDGELQVLLGSGGAIWVEAIAAEASPQFAEWRDAWREFLARLNRYRNLLQRQFEVPLFFVGPNWMPPLRPIRGASDASAGPASRSSVAERILPAQAMLKARVITAIFLLAGLLCALFLLPSWGWLAFVSVICATAAHEWGGIVGYKGARSWIYAVLLGALCLSFGLVAGLHRDDTVAPFNLVPAYGLSALFWVLCVPFWLRSRWALPGAGAAALVGFVLLIPPSLAMIHLRLLSPWLLLGVMASVWIADIAAYFTEIGRASCRERVSSPV